MLEDETSFSFNIYDLNDIQINNMFCNTIDNLNVNIYPKQKPI